MIILVYNVCLKEGEGRGEGAKGVWTRAREKERTGRWLKLQQKKRSASRVPEQSSGGGCSELWARGNPGISASVHASAAQIKVQAVRGPRTWGVNAGRRGGGRPAIRTLRREKACESERERTCVSIE
jgi:hypothetical protein